MIDVLGLFLSIKGRINFLQLGRFSFHNEQRYRAHFMKQFDFLRFNRELVLEHGSGHYTIAFDPSYINKTGKNTDGVGWYWSGVANKAKWGLEIGGIAAIDIGNHTAFHLEAVQTPNDRGSQTLLEYYAQTLIDRKEQLLSISTYVVADAYFSKKPFVSALCDNEFHIVSRLRNDADMQYKYLGKQRDGRGRPKLYGDKVEFDNLDMMHFSTIERNDENEIYQAIVRSKAMKRFINLVIVFSNRKGKRSHKLYFSTDLKLDPRTLLEYYQTRFQIEFIYRDGKQFTGLHDCQARSMDKLHFHFNTSLSAVNIAKITYWISIPKQERKAFSMSSVKTMCHNELLLSRFINVFGISPYKQLNKNKIRELVAFGAIAA